MMQWLQSDWRRFALLLIAAAVLGWFVQPAPESAAALVQARRDVWALAALPVPSDRMSLALQLASSPIWGPEDKKAEEAPIEDARWRLAGVYGAGKQGGALILFSDANKAPQRLKVGEKLPSGHPIEAVEGNQICIRIGKKLYRFGVEYRE